MRKHRISPSLPSSRETPGEPFGRPSLRPEARALGEALASALGDQVALDLGEQREERDHDLRLDIALAVDADVLLQGYGLESTSNRCSFTAAVRSSRMVCSTVPLPAHLLPLVRATPVCPPETAADTRCPPARQDGRRPLEPPRKDRRPWLIMSGPGQHPRALGGAVTPPAPASVRARHAKRCSCSRVSASFLLRLAERRLLGLLFPGTATQHTVTGARQASGAGRPHGANHPSRKIERRSRHVRRRGDGTRRSRAACAVAVEVPHRVWRWSRQRRLAGREVARLASPQITMRSISSSETASAVRSYSFVVFDDACPTIRWACSNV